MGELINPKDNENEKSHWYLIRRDLWRFGFSEWSLGQSDVFLLLHFNIFHLKIEIPVILCIVILIIASKSSKSNISTLKTIKFYRDFTCDYKRDLGLGLTFWLTTNSTQNRIFISERKSTSQRSSQDPSNFADFFEPCINHFYLRFISHRFSSTWSRWNFTCGHVNRCLFVSVTWKRRRWRFDGCRVSWRAS